MDAKALAVPLVLAVLAAPAAAGKPASPRTDYRISFSLRSGSLSASGSFAAAGGTQADYARRAEIPTESVTASGRTVVFRKRAVIANCLPLARGGGFVDLQCRFEISGPGAPVGELKARPSSTFRYQSEVLVRLGRREVLVDEPGRRVAVEVSPLAP